MKVLHVISGMDPKAGGVSQALVTMIHGLAAQGVTSDAVTMDDPDDGFLGDFNFSITGFGPSKTGWRYAPKLLVWLKKNIARYEIVIVHGLWQYHTHAAFRAWSRLSGNKPKLFVMPHGMLDPYFQKAANRRFKALRNLIIWQFLEKKLINVANGLLFTCDEEKNLARQTFNNYFPKKELVVGLGVEKPPQYELKMSLALEKNIGKHLDKFLLFISRIDTKKGVDILLKAYISLEKNHDLPMLLVAGPGLDTNYGKSILNIAAGHPKIIFPGMLSGDAKWGAFYGCEAFILPSHQENFGIAVVESLACGKPALISNQINIWREIDQGKGGIVNSDDEAGVIKILQQWINKTSEEKENMGSFAKMVFEENFAVDQAAKKLLEKITE